MSVSSHEDRAYYGVDNINSFLVHIGIWAAKTWVINNSVYPFTRFSYPTTNYFNKQILRKHCKFSRIGLGDSPKLWQRQKMLKQMFSFADSILFSPERKLSFVGENVQ